jgi:hypothetical protein
METTAISTLGRVPWNKGKFTGQKPPLKLKEIWAMRIRLELSARTRDFAIFNLAHRQQVESMRSDEATRALSQ